MFLCAKNVVFFRIHSEPKKCNLCNCTARDKGAGYVNVAMMSALLLKNCYQKNQFRYPKLRKSYVIGCRRRFNILGSLRSIKHSNHFIFIHISSSSFSSAGFHNPLAGFGLLILEVSGSHTTTHHSR
jgi:hypothetical protein